MRLSDREIDSILLHNAGFLAQKRLSRGLKLNYPESIALISTQVSQLVKEEKIWNYFLFFFLGFRVDP